MIAFLVPIAWSAQAALQLETNEVRAGQTVGLSLVVSDAQPHGVPTIRAPEGLTVRYATQSQQRMMINFQTTSTTTFQYEVSALTEGRYTIGPLSVATDAGNLTAPPVSLSVSPRGEAGALDTLAGSLGATVAYVGQVLVYHLRFTTENAVVSGRWAPPESPGLTPEPSVEPLTTEYTLDEGGKRVAVQELFYPVRATTTGRHVVPGGVLQAQFAVARRNSRRPDIFRDLGGFSDVRSENYSSEPLPLEIRDVPTEGRPEEWSGLVGSFTLDSRASSSSVQVGDTVTVEVILRGNGNLAGTKLPPIALDGLRVYDDQPSIEAKVTGGKYDAIATFKRAIVPEKPGQIVVPPVSVVWFDPATAAFASASAPAIELNVGGEAGNVAVASFGDAPQKGVETLGEDILPIRTGVHGGAPLSGRWAWALYLPGAGLLAFSLARRLTFRRKVAERPFGFEDLSPEPEARLAGLERILREAAARRLGRPADGLVEEDLSSLGEEAVAVYRELTTLRYGGRGTLPEDRVRALVASWG